MKGAKGVSSKKQRLWSEPMFGAGGGDGGTAKNFLTLLAGGSFLSLASWATRGSPCYQLSENEGLEQIFHQFLLLWGCVDGPQP